MQENADIGKFIVKEWLFKVKKSNRLVTEADCSWEDVGLSQPDTQICDVFRS